MPLRNPCNLSSIYFFLKKKHACCTFYFVLKIKGTTKKERNFHKIKPDDIRTGNHML